MDTNEVKNTTQNVSENEEETEQLRRELTALSLKGRINVPLSFIRKAKVETLRDLKKICDATRMKNFSRSATGKIVFIGACLLRKVDLVADSDKLKDDIMSDQMFLEDMEDLFGSLSNDVQKPGIVSCLSTVASHVIAHKFPTKIVEGIENVLQEVEEELNQVNQEASTVVEEVRTAPLD